MNEKELKKELKEVIFMIYSAGFEAGYSQEVDIVSAYNQYWHNLWDAIQEQFMEMG